MSRAASAQVERALRLLAHEGAGSTAKSSATAAGRVLDKLHQHLDPMLGVAGVAALLWRSARLAASDAPCLSEASVVESETSLSTCLAAQTPELALSSAAALFATFFSLVANFIGDRLTTQLLRPAWPTAYELPPKKDEP